MNGQLTLDDAARATDPETSHIAATNARRHTETDRELVLRLLRTHGPMTDFEIAARAGRAQTSLGVRRGDLVKLGLVEYAGFARPAPSGSPARVWRAL